MLCVTVDMEERAQYDWHDAGSDAAQINTLTQVNVATWLTRPSPMDNPSKTKFRECRNNGPVPARLLQYLADCSSGESASFEQGQRLLGSQSSDDPLTSAATLRWREPPASQLGCYSFGCATCW